MIKFIFSSLNGGFGVPYLAIQLGAVLLETFPFTQTILYLFLTFLVGDDPAYKERVIRIKFIQTE